MDYNAVAQIVSTPRLPDCNVWRSCLAECQTDERACGK